MATAVSSVRSRNVRDMMFPVPDMAHVIPSPGNANVVLDGLAMAAILSNVPMTAVTMAHV